MVGQIEGLRQQRSKVGLSNVLLRRVLETAFHLPEWRLRGLEIGGFAGECGHPGGLQLRKILEADSSLASESAQLLEAAGPQTLSSRGFTARAPSKGIRCRRSNVISSSLNETRRWCSFCPRM